MKTCKHCGERSSDEAITCFFCGETDWRDDEEETEDDE